ncbi:MAG: M48 family metallopeptidase [Pyrinomonadaceae bacterium]|nr:M48 family metallopeptidase [Pyrinomonadaceae bacterium]MCX7640837.1 M48 family metallopeptidase [Pyrinomonadaceae bacterium]MDW8303398.1 M48 family metallopeptidase [Acidobacteriota bacterium]
MQKRIFLLAFTLAAALSVFAQTAVKMPKNKYKIEEDVKIGQEASQEVESKLPILRDREVEQYVQSVGRRLVKAIPDEFNEPRFNYTFKVVNLSDINAFALPGGPIYINRGLIEVAKNEGELAGVIAHEISHVALRHATAQATKMSNPLNQILVIGSILGGAIIGGDLGASLGQMAVAGYFLRYSREYETQADILGARIMARAGYDPQDLANMFRTIEEKSKGARPPEWLSSHPNPGNRYQKISQEARYLEVSPNPIKVTPEFLRVQRRLQSLPKADSMEKGDASRAGGGTYRKSIPEPSSRLKTYSNNSFRVGIPDNWEIVNESASEVWFSPRGAYGRDGITHGVVVGIKNSRGRNTLSVETDNFVNEILRINDFLRKRSSQKISFINRNGILTVLSGRSPITGEIEIAKVHTAFSKDGRLFYLITVAPEREFDFYAYTFDKIIDSVKVNEF